MMVTDSTRKASSFHEGELRIQERLGISAKMDKVARQGIRDYMPDQHRQFFAKLPFLIVGTVDNSGQPWASILVDAPGFITSPDARQLVVSAIPPHADPLHRTLRVGAPTGLLGIEYHTRRRNRANGTVSEVFDTGFSIQITQSFGNCPKYIQARRWLADQSDRGIRRNARVHHRQTLDPAMQRIIRNADTFFIASAYPDGHVHNGPEQGVDVSHRGGRPGFVQLDTAAEVLTVPDFVGNFFFNTLGNLLLNPQAGLLFMDFDSGDLLYLAVETEIIWDGPEVAGYLGAQRLLRMRVREGVRVESVLPGFWSAPELSPHL